MAFRHSCVISSSRRDVDEIRIFLGYYAALSGSSVPTFRATCRSHLQGSRSTITQRCVTSQKNAYLISGILVGNFRHSWTFRPLKIRTLHSFKTSGFYCPLMQRHIPEGGDPKSVAASVIFRTFKRCISNLLCFGARGQCLGVRLHGEMKISRRFGDCCSCHLQGELGVVGRPHRWGIQSGRQPATHRVVRSV
jgi:hypothetical protein